MPAVQLSRLNEFISELVLSFDHPDEFMRKYHGLCERYADRVTRLSATLSRDLSLPAYGLPPVIAPRIHLGLVSPCRQDCIAGLKIIDRLWADEILESRQIAALLLGDLIHCCESEVAQRVELWVSETISNETLHNLFGSTTRLLQQQAPERWLALVRNWLSSPNEIMIRTGLEGLLSICQDPEFENLPLVFSLFKPILVNLDISLLPAAQALVAQLYLRSPVETGFYLQQIIKQSSSPIFQRLIRRAMPNFSPELQKKLRPWIKSSFIVPE